jgi:hypothetical protein
MRHYTKRHPRWTPERQAAAMAAKQAIRDERAADLDAAFDDARAPLRLTISDERDGTPLVDWRLIPARRNARQYRVLDCATGQPPMRDGLPVGGGKDRIMQAAAALMPCYGGFRV